jgi:two-component system response regulator GlrR
MASLDCVETWRGAVLLLDCDSSSELGISLRDKLGSAASADISLEYKSFAEDAREERATDAIERTRPDLVIIAVHKSSIERACPLFRRIIVRDPNLPIVVAIEDMEREDLLRLFEFDGIVDFIAAPFKQLEIQVRIGRILERAHLRRDMVRQVTQKLQLKQLVGHSIAFAESIASLADIAKCDAGVLISGETGTGKELAARAIHYLSSRSSRPFVPVNCGAIPLELVESELFGHERGAFTGASTSTIGLVREADSGTLFLDEVCSLPLQAQVKLLRLLQEKEYRPVGSSKVLKADLRIIAASNVDFEEAVLAGRFRQDLYYRLNVLPLKLPALRERAGDVALLAKHFLAKYSREFNKQARDFSRDALYKLELYDWPGNVRELEHVIERAVALCGQDTISGGHIVIPKVQESVFQSSYQEMKARVVSDFERTYIERLLLIHRGNISRAAQAARKERRTFWELIRKHRIDVQRFKAQTD